jgi:hypothetical protein
MDEAAKISSRVMEMLLRLPDGHTMKALVSMRNFVDNHFRQLDLSSPKPDSSVDIRAKSRQK